MSSSSSMAGIRRINRWTTLALTIFLLTCPLVVLQVQVAPGVESTTTTGRFERKNAWMLASEFRGEVPKQSRQNLARVFEIKWLLWGWNLWQEFQGTRLVAHAFLGPPPSKAVWQVNHIDGNCSNNRIDNLEWVSHSENIRHWHATNPSRGNAGSSLARPVMIRPLGSHKWSRF